MKVVQCIILLLYSYYYYFLSHKLVLPYFNVLATFHGVRQANLSPRQKRGREGDNRKGLSLRG